MRNGFQVLKTRLGDIDSVISNLEEKYGLKLPPIYKQFVSWFEVGNELFITDKYYIESYDDYFYASYQKYPSDIDFEIGVFLSLDEVFENWKNEIGYGDEDYTNGYLQIGDINRGGAIFVGTKGQDFEKIIVSIWDFDPCYFELAQDIMDFVSKIKIVPVPEEDLIDGIRFKQLYKNWGENFWRVQED